MAEDPALEKSIIQGGIGLLLNATNLQIPTFQQKNTSELTVHTMVHLVVLSWRDSEGNF